MTNSTTTSDSLHDGRHDRLLQEWEHDTYKSKKKPREPTVCPICRAFFHKGRWQWGSAPEGADEETCPACHRMEDRVPAGFLTVTGGFLAEHSEEIMNLIHNVAEKERAEHPLKRIMHEETLPDGLLISFTDPHLARGVGEALHHAYKGELDFTYQAEERLLRVSWER